MRNSSEWKSSAPLVIAHRGASAYAPENTMAAFKHASELGSDAIELDAKLTRDGVVAILHDDTIDRTTDGSGKLRKFSFDEIREFDAGIKFSTEYAGEKIPSLAEIFKQLGEEMLINVELTNYTSPWDALAERVIELIQKFNLKERILLSSFNPVTLAKCRRISKEIHTALLIHGKVPRLLQNNLRTLLNYDFIHAHESLISSEYMKDQAKRDGKVNAWTVNDESRMGELLTLGIAGIITDVPDVAKRVRDEYVATTRGV